MFTYNHCLLGIIKVVKKVDYMDENLQNINASTQDDIVEKKRDIEEKLLTFNNNVASIKKVAEKLVTKNNEDVYNKLGDNSEKTFEIIESIPSKDIVDTGMTEQFMSSIIIFRSTMVELKNYKINLDNYNKEFFGETPMPGQNKTYELSSIPTVPNLSNEDVA